MNKIRFKKGSFKMGYCIDKEEGIIKIKKENMELALKNYQISFKMEEV